MVSLEEAIKTETINFEQAKMLADKNILTIGENNLDQVTEVVGEINKKVKDTATISLKRNSENNIYEVNIYMNSQVHQVKYHTAKVLYSKYKSTKLYGVLMGERNNKNITINFVVTENNNIHLPKTNIRDSRTYDEVINLIDKCVKVSQENGLKILPKNKRV